MDDSLSADTANSHKATGDPVRLFIWARLRQLLEADSQPQQVKTTNHPRATGHRRCLVHPRGLQPILKSACATGAIHPGRVSRDRSATDRSRFPACDSATEAWELRDYRTS